MPSTARTTEPTGPRRASPLPYTYRNIDIRAQCIAAQKVIVQVIWNKQGIIRSSFERDGKEKQTYPI